MKQKFKITFEDTQLIRDFEGFSLEAYKDIGGIPTIGWGLPGPTIKMGMKITKAEAEKIFIKRIKEVCKQIEEAVKIDLNKNQFCAILSIIWNIGIGEFKKSTLLKKLNEGDIGGASKQFERWNKVGSKSVAGLTRRRLAEKELFLKKVV